MHRACWGDEERHTQTVKAFLDAGVDPEQPTKAGQSVPPKPYMLTHNKATKDLLGHAMDAKRANDEL